MMSPLIIIIPVVVLVILIVAGIGCFCLLKKCVRWRAVSLVNPMRSTSDNAIIQNSVYTMSSVEGNYQTLGSLPNIGNADEKIPIEEDAVDSKKSITTDTKENSYPQELVISTVDNTLTSSPFKYGNLTRNSIRMSLKIKLTQMLLRSQEIMNKKNMGVYNIRENECKYYEENHLNNGETNINYEHDNHLENFEHDRPIREEVCLNPSSNTRTIQTIEAYKSKSIKNFITNVSPNVSTREVLKESENENTKENMNGNIKEVMMRVVENESRIRI